MYTIFKLLSCSFTRSYNEMKAWNESFNPFNPIDKSFDSLLYAFMIAQLCVLYVAGWSFSLSAGAFFNKTLIFPYIFFIKLIFPSITQPSLPRNCQLYCSLHILSYAFAIIAAGTRDRIIHKIIHDFVSYVKWVCFVSKMLKCIKFRVLLCVIASTKWHYNCCLSIVSCRCSTCSRVSTERRQKINWPHILHVSFSSHSLVML